MIPGKIPQDLSSKQWAAGQSHGGGGGVTPDFVIKLYNPPPIIQYSFCI